MDLSDPSISHRLSEQRLALNNSLHLNRDIAATASTSFSNSLHSIQSQSQQTLQNREKLAKIKDHVKELEAEFGEVLAVKTCKDGKCTTIAEALATTTTRIKQLERIVQDQRGKKNEYAAVISQQLLAFKTLEGKSDKYITEKEKIDEALLWYSRVLGFRIEGGEGVKFIFNKIDPKNPDAEYTFTIRLDGDIYNLLHCDLHTEDTTGLVKDLNESKDLFKFARVMRESFKSSLVNGVPSTKRSVTQQSMTVSSPPPTSMDSSRVTVIQQKDRPLQPQLNGHKPQKSIRSQIASPSPDAVSACRRSPRLRAQKLP